MEPTETTQDRTRYVEELESQDDYWLSITDAARVCRVQDVSIRRAIASGRLPVRKQGAGDNKRTRFVRASDLPKANFPILDSGAAITSDIRKVDVLNLPLQIQRLTEQFAALRGEQTGQLNHIGEQLKAVQGDQTGIQEQIGQITIEVTTLNDRQVQQFATLEEAQNAQASHDQQEREAIQTALTEMGQQQTKRMEEIVAQVQQIQTHLQEVETHLQGLIQQAYERLQARFQENLAALRRDLEEREAKKIDALTRMIEQERQQREQFERIMTNVASNADRTASEAKATVASLTSLLEAERTARQALEERLNHYIEESAKASTPPPTRKADGRRRKATTEPSA